MAQLRFEVFDFDIGDWESYIERFEFFLEAHGVTVPATQKAVFYASCGSDLYNLVKSLVFPKTINQVTLLEVIEILKKHFNPRPNEIVESYKFHTRTQGPEESIHDFIASLRKMSRYCNFTDLERTLRDRIVCGVRDPRLQECLLKKENLTYESAIEMALQSEKRAEDLKIIQIPMSKNNPMDYGQPGNSRSSEGEPMDVNAVSEDKQRNARLKCYRCGGNHLYHNCRFSLAKCLVCKKIGHIARVCRLKKKDSADVKEIQEQEKDFMNGLHCIGGKPRTPPIYIEIELNKNKIQFEVDSGSSYTIISEEKAWNIWPTGIPNLDKCNLNLQTWTFNKVHLLGSIQVPVKYKGFKGNLELLIAKGTGQSLLGRNWFASLGISVEGINVIQIERKREVGSHNEDFAQIYKKYKEVFEGELGGYKGPEVEIQCKENVQPKFMRSRPIPFALKDRVCEEIERLVKTDVIEPIPYSNWATPIVPVVKPNGTIRLCGDYRLTVNLATDTDTYPQPTINESLSDLAGGKIFSKLDLKEAYTQVKVTDETSRLLTINTPKGLYRMKRLPYGLKACPGIFQRLMSTTLAGIKGVSVLLDDILIAGCDQKQHLERLERVLECLKSVGLTLNKNKCKIGTDRVEFLGFVVDREGVHPSIEKITAIRNAKPPQNIKELQAFLGLLNFYERFIKNKATVLEPLHRLLDKNTKWKWGIIEEDCFSKAKLALSDEHTLVHFDNNKRISLTCDASEYGVGAVLAHIMEDGTEKPIAMGSRTLNKHERRYAQIDKEAAAIMFGVEKFNQYVYGRPVVIYTDHKPLLGIFSPNKAIPKVLSPRMMRWALKLNSYDYELKHKSGISIGNADALSRWPMEVSNEEVHAEYDGEILLLSEMPSAVLYTAKDIAEHTNRDEVLTKVKYWILHGWPDRVDEAELKVFWLKRKELSLSNDCIIWGPRVVIPSTMREYMLQALHETHDGIVISKSIARSYFWWPGLDNEIEMLVAGCETCQGNRKMPATTAHSWITPTNPWQRLHIDFAGPFKGKTYLIVIDPHSKWPEVKIVNTTSSQCAIRALRQIFSEQGLPEVLVSDNGTAFTSEEFKKFLKCNGIRHILTPPYSPSSNGQAERTVQTVKNKLRALSGNDMTVILPRLLFGLRIAPSTVTGKSPAEVLNKRRFRSRFDIIHPFAKQSVAEKQIESNKETSVRLFQLNDKVWLRNYAKGEKWVKGIIVRIKGPVRFLVKMVDGPIVTRHVNQLRKRYENINMPGISTELREQLGIPNDAVVTFNGDTIEQSA